MGRDRIVTASLFLLLTLTLVSSVVRLNSLGQQPPARVPQGATGHSLGREMSAAKTQQEWDALLNKLPVADYEASELSEPAEREKRRVRNGRYDKRGMVIQHPDVSVLTTEAVHEGKGAWSLPVDQSDVVMVGEVRDRQSYLSNDKTGVYTEFTIVVSEVLKGDPTEVKAGTKITASREGGVVRYPGGYKRLYVVVGEGLPLENGEFVLFLKGGEKGSDYTILTMYQLESGLVIPIDEGQSFESYRGQTKTDLLKAIQDKLSNSSDSRLVK